MTTKAMVPLVVFFVLLVGFSGAFTVLAVTSGFHPRAVTGLMWSVGLAAMAALKLTGGSLSELGWSWGPAKYHLIAIALPLVYCTLAYGGAAAFGLIGFAAPDNLQAFAQSTGVPSSAAAFTVPLALALAITVGMVQPMSTALGEEIGWRGFLAPRMVALSGFVPATLIVGAIWAAWHGPLIVFSRYNGGGDIRLELAAFGVFVLAASGVLTWLRLSARSLWPCVTFHAAHNLIVQSIFDPLTTRGAGEITIVGEFGAGLAAIVVLMSLPFWIMGARRNWNDPNTLSKTHA